MFRKKTYRKTDERPAHDPKKPDEIYRTLSPPAVEPIYKAAKSAAIEVTGEEIGDTYDAYYQFLAHAKTHRELEIRKRLVCEFERPADELPKGRDLPAAINRMTRKMEKFGEDEIASMTGRVDVVTRKENEPDGYREETRYLTVYNRNYYRENKPKWDTKVEKTQIPIYKEKIMPDHVCIKINYNGSEMVFVPREVTFERIKTGIFVSSTIGIILAIAYEVIK